MVKNKKKPNKSRKHGYQRFAFSLTSWFAAIFSPDYAVASKSSVAADDMPTFIAILMSLIWVLVGLAVLVGLVFAIKDHASIWKAWDKAQQSQYQVDNNTSR